MESVENNLFAEEDVQQPVQKLYDLNTIMLATLLGGPLSGGYLLYYNYKALGEEEGGKNTIIWAVLISTVLFGTLMALPENIVDKLPNMVIPWISALVAYFIGRKLQGEVLEEHKQQGGVFYSRWRALWIGVVFVLITLALIFPFAIFMS